MEQKKKTVIFRCFYGYMISGMAVLIIGAILPDVIVEAKISYAAAGGLISVMAIGNLLASFIFPMLSETLGRRITITAAAFLVPVSMFAFTFLPPVPVMYLLIFLCGIGRGSITITNNLTVNDLSNSSTKMMNYLHCSFAVGAFLAPFMMSLFHVIGFGWRNVIYIIVALCLTSSVSYATIDYSILTGTKKALTSNVSQKGECTGNNRFLKSADFYCVAMILFFYMGLENCVNGWFITYLKDTGVMSTAFATTLVSFTWLVIMFGRLTCAAVSNHISKSTIILINAIGSAVCFFVLISSKNLMAVTASLLLLGFFMSGFYPTCTANVGHLIHGTTLGMSLLTAIGSIGGIITPQIVGSLADQSGLVAAIGVLSVNIFAMLILSAIAKKRIP